MAHYTPKPPISARCVRRSDLHGCPRPRPGHLAHVRCPAHYLANASLCQRAGSGWFCTAPAATPGATDSLSSCPCSGPEPAPPATTEGLTFAVLGSSVPCKPIEAESRPRGARKSGVATAGRGGSFFRSPRAPRAPRPGARPPPKDGTDPAPASSHHPSSLSPQFDYPGFSFPPGHPINHDWHQTLTTEVGGGSRSFSSFTRHTHARSTRNGGAGPRTQQCTCGQPRHP